MSYTVYILYSKKLNRFYIGYSFNLENRIKEHNTGESPYTSHGRPWTLLWSTAKDSFRRAEALEFKLKNLSQSRKIKFMMKYSEGVVDQLLLLEIKNKIG